MESKMLKLILVGLALFQVVIALNSKDVKVTNQGNPPKNGKSSDFKTRFLKTLTSVENLLKKDQDDKRKKEEQNSLQKELEKISTRYGDNIFKTQENLQRVSSEMDKMVEPNIEDNVSRFQSDHDELPEMQHFSSELNAKRVVDSGASLYCRYQQVKRYRTYVYHGQMYHYPYYETVKYCDGW